jgi:hypothetical protein
MIPIVARRRHPRRHLSPVVELGDERAEQLGHERREIEAGHEGA